MFRQTPIIMLLWLGCIAPVLGQFKISQGVLGNGAGTLSSSNFRIQSTLGQASIGSLASPIYRVQTGFWYGPSLITSIHALEHPLLTKFELLQNYPNPFNPTTTICFSLHLPSEVCLEVYNVLGQRVAILVNGTLSAGNHTVVFDAHHLAGGVYFYRITAQEIGLRNAVYQSIKRMVLLK